MARGDPTYAHVDVSWPADARSRTLSPAENWLYIVCYLAAVEHRSNRLPAACNVRFLCGAAGVRCETMDSLLRKSAEFADGTPMIFSDKDGRICVKNSGDRHPKLHWKGERMGPECSPSGDDMGPVSSPPPSVPPSVPPSTPLPPKGEFVEPRGFAEFWNNYPRKLGRKAAARKYATTLKAGATAADLLSASRHYAIACCGKEAQYIKHGATFLGPDEHWKEYVGGVPDGAKSTPISIDPPHVQDWLKGGKP